MNIVVAFRGQFAFDFPNLIGWIRRNHLPPQELLGSTNDRRIISTFPTRIGDLRLKVRVQNVLEIPGRNELYRTRCDERYGSRRRRG